MNDKPRLVQINKEELAEIRAKPGDLALPFVVPVGDALYVDADELRAWRASQHTSEGK
jgi:hypothetical protein